MHAFAFGVAGGKTFFGLWSDLELYQARLGYGCHHRDRGLGRIGRDVLHQDEDHAIGNIWWQMKTFSLDLVFAVFLILHSDFAAGSIDRNFHGMLERRAALYQMIAEQSESAVLRENRSLVMQ